MADSTTTGEPIGYCFKCGWPIWEGCSHFCSTTVRQTIVPAPVDPRDACIKELEAQLAQLASPVSNKEWGEYQECMRVGCDRIPTHYERATADAIIANRAKPQKEESNG